MSIARTARLLEATAPDAFANPRFDAFLESIAEPGPMAEWLASQSDALARIRADREAERAGREQG